MKRFYEDYQFKNSPIVIGTPRITNLLVNHVLFCPGTTVRYPAWLFEKNFIPKIIIMNRILFKVI